MAKINFPDPSTTNPWYNPSNGITYVHANDTWSAVTVNNTNFDDTYVNVDGDQMTGDLTVPSLNGGPLAGFRNLLINGDFRIWQRGTSFTAPGAPAVFYTADRWRHSAGPSDVTYERETEVPSSGKFSYSMSLTDASLPVAQPIELGANGQLPTGAGQYTISAWANNGSTTIVGFFLETPDGVIEMTPGEYPLSPIESLGNWHRYSYTFEIPTFVNTGTTAMTAGIVIEPTLLAGGTAYITGVQLEPGPVATPFEYRPIGTELALCQRYYVSFGTVEQIASYRPSSRGCAITFPTTMRALPTITTADYNYQFLTGGDFTAYDGAGRGVRMNLVGFTLTQDWSAAPIMLMCRDVVADAEL